jgi:disulfide bond formation protein DsbB
MSPEAQLATDILVFATIMILITIVAILIGLLFFRTRFFAFLAQRKVPVRLLATLVAFSALAGSTIYGVITGFKPCALCITSRTIMGLILVTLPLAMIAKLKERTVLIVGLFLAVLGFCVSLYQYVLQWLALTGTHLPCPAVSGLASCDRIYFIEFGFITIPFVALSAFTLIALLLYIARKMSASDDTIAPVA